MRGIGYRKSGRPYDPGQVATSICLPPSIFSSVFLTPLCISSHQLWGEEEFFTLLVPQVVCYIVGLMIQGSFIWYIWDVIEEEQVCNSPEGFVKLICITTFVGKCIADIAETVQMHQFINTIPSWDPDEHREILDDVGEYSGLTNLAHQKYKSEEEDDVVEVVKPATGITGMYRTFTYLFVMMPKLAIAVGLAVIGGGHILASADVETFILNTLASVFIFEIDDIIYQLMIPKLYKNWLETEGTFTYAEDEVGCLSKYSFYINTTTLGLAVAFIIWLWCY
mmetsp:Transcript_6217/g.11296  ORF Transcript_6217/g.11296 Transcript_6217/m.11296 type:complete len:280 (+) Transcript_6217:2-841(+)